MGSMAYVPFQLPKNELPLPQHHVASQSPAWTSTTQDPYYSNEDIEILHEIVSIAQEKLEDVSDARPLPAAALFNAYDEVLPKHGVDPDDENHLSRLIFRIGGEKSSGSLPEKFRAVLASMGISLEYGDSSPVSLRASRSLHSSLDVSLHDEVDYQNVLSALPRPGGNHTEPATPWPRAIGYGDESMEMEWKSADKFATLGSVSDTNPKANSMVENVSNHLSLQPESQQGVRGRISHSSMPPATYGSQASARDVLRFSGAEEEIPKLRAALSRPPLLSILDRWRTASTREKLQRASSHSLENANLSALGADGSKGSDAKIHQPQTRSPLTGCYFTQQAESSSEPKAEHHEDAISLLPVPATHHRLLIPREQEGEGHGDYTAMLNRAGRAREIYLASRAFNHWAERTAARLEKEAVARRHMIRYRCFRGWSNAPNSKSPAVDNLRAATAVQKLRRAVACQEEQLRAAASAISETNCLRKAKRAMRHWLCSTTQQQIRCETAHRFKQGLAHSWKRLMMSHQKHAESVTEKRQATRKQHLIHHWAGKAQQAERQYTISTHVGLVRPLFAHLAAWWDHMEVENRADIYRANLAWMEAHSTLDIWNLRARAQACVWRSDYQTVVCTLGKWTRVMENGRTEQSRATSDTERYRIPATLARVGQFVNYTSKLEYYAHRARLFILASKFLRVLDRAYEFRKASRKEEVRQQLRARYKEVSSARKKRQFHSALGAWRSSAQSHASTATETKGRVERQRQTFKLDTVRTWLDTASRNQEQHATSQNHVLHHGISGWRELSNELTEQDARCWDMWMQRKQRQILKVWSISSLQGSGRAHTATMVQQRHEVEKRNRAFHFWRHSGPDSEATDAKYASVTPRHLSVPGRRSWRILSSRKPTTKHEAVPQDLRAFNMPAASPDTPTRWTGRPLVVPSTLAKPMRAVKEADEQSTTASSLSDEAEVGYDLATSTKASQQSFHRNLVWRTGKITSTTPQAPPPTSLRRSIQFRNPAFTSSAMLAASERTVRPGGSVNKQLERPERKTKQFPGYVDSAIQTGLSARPGPLSQRPPTLNRNGPATPSRQPTRNGTRGESGAEPLDDWTHVTRTAPQPSRFAGERRN